MSRSFGFEAEFGTGVAALTQALHAEGLCGMSSPHSWHCQCEHCDFSNSRMFRVQTDSSCDGEVITQVMSTRRWAEAKELMQTLQDLAVQYDAEPNLRAGCHVHVSVGHLSENEKVAAFRQFVRWEDIISRVSSGRWAHNRGANRTVADTLDYYGYTLRIDDDRWDDRYQCHYDADRHSNLNLNTRHDTWEFRIWNSTRVAWRMELWCRLSLALTDMGTVSALEAVDDPWDDTFAEAIKETCAKRTHDLLQRQFTYLNEQAVSAPALLTV